MSFWQVSGDEPSGEAGVVSTAPAVLCPNRHPSLSTEARQGQPESDHLLAIANQQEVADQYRMVPGLAIERREPRELRELVGGRRNQSQLTVLR